MDSRSSLFGHEASFAGLRIESLEWLVSSEYEPLHFGYTRCHKLCLPHIKLANLNKALVKRAD